MKKALTRIALVSAVFGLPLAAYAATINNISDAGSFVINTINGILVPILFAVAFIVFIWGAFQTFILGAQSSDVKKAGQNHMMWGLIGFFVMVSVWGLVNILTGTIGFGNNTGPSGGTPSAGVQIGG